MIRRIFDTNDREIFNQLLHTPSREKWRKLGLIRRSGVLVPLFSVWSKKSVGIGELGDIKLLVDWCKKTGNSILQLLPMNDVGHTNCPYDATSSFAIEPSYITLEDIAPAHKHYIRDEIAELKKRYPCGSGRIDYKIKKEKLRILKEMFKEVDDGDSREYKEFCDENRYWLDDYALFKALKAHTDSAEWYDWDEGYKYRDPEILGDFKKRHERDVHFFKWVQWQLYKQFVSAKSYAKSKGIFIKGDLPILISGDSADVWAHQEFFKLDFEAGAPPDMYCAKGQRWGMPTYDWPKIAENGYQYLIEKLQYAENFYDILRVDHVAGLFRIWAIPHSDPVENVGLGGFFDPQNESEWEGHGRTILSTMLNDTHMLLCAEDLGIVPDSCKKAMWEFGIPGNDVQRWVKDWAIRHDFLSPQEFRFLSVAMLSTHDTTNAAAWWADEAGTVDEGLIQRKCNERGFDFNMLKERLFNLNKSRNGRLRWHDRVASSDILAQVMERNKEEIMDFVDLYENSFQEKEKFWRNLKIRGRMREKADKDIITSLLRYTLQSNSIFCIHLILDWLYMGDVLKGDPAEFRFNVPGTISDSNWSLTLPVSLEDLIENRLSHDIKQLNNAFGRK